MFPRPASRKVKDRVGSKEELETRRNKEVWRENKRFGWPLPAPDASVVEINPHLHTHKSFTGAAGRSAGNRGLRFAAAQERQRRVQGGRWPEWLGALTQEQSSRGKGRGRHGLCKIWVVSYRDAKRTERNTTPCQRHPQRERRRRNISAWQGWASKEQKWAKVVGQTQQQV